MAQDFRNSLQDDLPTSHNDTNSLLWTAGDFANITTSPVTIDVYIRNSSTDYYLLKNGPLPAGSSFELIAEGSKIVLKNGDVLYAIASAGSSVDVVTSVVDTISA